MDKRERVARAIFNVNSAEKFTWESTHDLVRIQCFRMADAAIAALEPVTVQEDARVVLESIERTWREESGYPEGYGDTKNMHPEWVLSRLRALAERGE